MDLIERQAAIKTLEKGLPSEPLKSKYTEGITVGFGLAITWIEQLPAVQTCEDAVSRAAAIAAVSNWLYDRDDGRSVDQLLSTLPSVQPEPKPDKNGSEPFGNAEMMGDRTTDDCISRQAAIDKLDPLFESLAIDKIKALPIAQGVIRCKDCRYQDKGCYESESWNLCGYRPWLHVPTEDEHYCGYAVRKENR